MQLVCLVYFASNNILYCVCGGGGVMYIQIYLK